MHIETMPRRAKKSASKFATATQENGAVIMPPFLQVSEAETKTLTEWIFSAK